MNGIKEFSVIGRTKKGFPEFKIQQVDLFRSCITDTDGYFLLTITPIDPQTELQLWHFRKVVVSVFRKLSIDQGTLMTEDEAELILLHEVCKISIDKKLEDLKSHEISAVIDNCKLWINDFFADTKKAGQRKLI